MRPANPSLNPLLVQGLPHLQLPHLFRVFGASVPIHHRFCFDPIAECAGLKVISSNLACRFPSSSGNQHTCSSHSAASLPLVYVAVRKGSDAPLMVQSPLEIGGTATTALRRCTRSSTDSFTDELASFPVAPSHTQIFRKRANNNG